MLQRNIFKNKKTNNKYYIFLLIVFLIILLYFIYSNKIYNYEIFSIVEYKNSFYNIPEDKKGKNIPNTNIKILDYRNNQIIDIDKIMYDYGFSIQLYSSSKYDDVVRKKNDFLNNSIIEGEELFIAVLKHNLGIDYLLLYKNFESYNVANVFCLNYLKLIDYCLIVNVQKLD